MTVLMIPNVPFVLSTRECAPYLTLECYFFLINVYADSYLDFLSERFFQEKMELMSKFWDKRFSQPLGSQIIKIVYNSGKRYRN